MWFTKADAIKFHQVLQRSFQNEYTKFVLLSIAKHKIITHSLKRSRSTMSEQLIVIDVTPTRSPHPSQYLSIKWTIYRCKRCVCF